MNYSSSTSSWKSWRWVRLDLIISMRDIYLNCNLNPLTKFTSSSRSTTFKDVHPWNISQMISKNVPNSTRIVISYVMKWGIPLWIWWKVNGNWDNNMIRFFQWRESYCRINTSVRRKKSKRPGLWEPQSGIQVGKLTIWVRSKIITEFTRVHQVVTTDEFSVRVTKITLMIGVLWTHSLPFYFLTYLNLLNYDHIIKSM